MNSTGAEAGLFDRLIDVLLPGGGYVMTLFEAYFDESYERSSLMVVAGYLIRSDQAREMDGLWKEALDDYGLPYFHMVDCAHKAGPFKGMSDDRCIEIATKMIALTAKSEFGVAAIVNPTRFSKANTGSDPYIFCVDLCVTSLCSWLSDKKPARIAFFLESGHASEAKSDASLARLKNDPEVSQHYVSHTFARKQDVRLLQAADLLAWQSTKFMKDKISRKRKPRGDFVELLKHPHAFHYVICHNNDMAISIDEQPHIPHRPRDDYLRAMFSYDVRSDRELERMHAKLKFRQRVLGDVTFPEDEPDD